MQLKNVGNIEGGSRMLEPSASGEEDGGATNQGSSKRRKMHRFR